MTTVIEGEVVSSSEVAVLPPDVQSRVDELRPLDGAAQAVRVTAMLSHARTGLLVAIVAQDLPQIKEWKQKASAIHEIAKQVRMAREFQDEAAEFTRRAERGLSSAVREGQSQGEIATKASPRSRSAYVREQDGKVIEVGPSVQDEGLTLPSPSEYFQDSADRRDCYAMTDGVSDEQFEEALAEAKAEGNLSRANVARKCKDRAQGKRDVVDPDDPLIDAAVVPVKKTARARRTIEMLSVTTANLALSVGDIDPGEVDREQLAKEISIIFESLGTIRSFLRKVNEQ